MKTKITKLTQPYIDIVEKRKRYDAKINELNSDYEALRAIDPLDLTLQQYIGLQQVDDFMDYLNNYNAKTINITSREKEMFNKISEVIAEEMNQDTDLTEVAKPFIEAVLNEINRNPDKTRIEFVVSSIKRKVSELQDDYNKVYNEALNRIIDEVKPLIEEYIEALKYKNIKPQYWKMFENSLPKPLNPYIIFEWDDYQREKAKYRIMEWEDYQGEKDKTLYRVPNAFLKLK